MATGVGLALRAVLSTTDVAMLYLLAAVVVGSRVRQRPALVASVLSIALFDFCFVPPYYTFAVHDASYVLTFGMMLAIAVIMSRLTGRIREQADASRAREQRTASAFALSREMAGAREAPEIIAAATRHIEDAFAGRVTFLLINHDGTIAGDDGVARWAMEHGQMAGLGTSTLPASPALYLPLQASDRWSRGSRGMYWIRSGASSSNHSSGRRSSRSSVQHSRSGTKRAAWKSRPSASARRS